MHRNYAYINYIPLKLCFYLLSEKEIIKIKSKVELSIPNRRRPLLGEAGSSIWMRISTMRSWNISTNPGDWILSPWLSKRGGLHLAVEGEDVPRVLLILQMHPTMINSLNEVRHRLAMYIRGLNAYAPAGRDASSLGHQEVLHPDGLTPHRPWSRDPSPRQGGRYSTCFPSLVTRELVRKLCSSSFSRERCYSHHRAAA